MFPSVFIFFLFFLSGPCLFDGFFHIISGASPGYTTIIVNPGRDIRKHRRPLTVIDDIIIQKNPVPELYLKRYDYVYKIYNKNRIILKILSDLLGFFAAGR